MKVKDLKSDKYIIQWFDDLDCEENTEIGYLQGMQAYTEYTGMSPKELLDDAKAELKAGTLMSERNIKGYLNRFRRHLREKDLADTTVKARIAAVKSFYQSFDIDLPRTKRSNKNNAKMLEENKETPKKEDLQDVLKVADPLEKAILLVGVSSGLSLNEIQNLRINDFKNGYDPESGITTLDLRRGKTDVDFITFLTPEASKAVMDYLNYRDREPKIHTPRRQSQLAKQKIISDDGYLFILRNVPDEYLVQKKESLRQLTPVAISKIYRSLSEKAQKNTKKGSYNVIRSHNMRKYFNSALLNANADSFHVEYWMGHKIDNTQAAYFRASPEKLREIYKKYMPYLAIQKELDVAESEDYKRIKEENVILRAETARHVVERQEFQDLRVKNENLSVEHEDLRIENEAALARISDLEHSQCRVHELEEKIEGLTRLLDIEGVVDAIFNGLRGDHGRMMETDPVYRAKINDILKKPKKDA